MGTKPKTAADQHAASPTKASYSSLDRAYDHFNTMLFGSALPRCLITVTRHKGAYGYFAPQRFTDAAAPSAEATVDEIALNPAFFAHRPPTETLSTLVHEMAHLWQAHFGKASRNGYHNHQWASKMKEIGLQPTDCDGKGREVGQKITHKIVEDGPFARACARFLHTHQAVLFHDRWSDEEQAKAKKKAKSKTKYVCPGCAQNAWAKPGASLMCGDCEERMEAEEPEED
jgi:predicted SprT family Zn-dependent metalloprotease